MSSPWNYEKRHGGDDDNDHGADDDDFVTVVDDDSFGSFAQDYETEVEKQIALLLENLDAELYGEKEPSSQEVVEWASAFTYLRVRGCGYTGGYTSSDSQQHDNNDSQHQDNDSQHHDNDDQQHDNNDSQHHYNDSQQHYNDDQHQDNDDQHHDNDSQHQDNAWPSEHTETETVEEVLATNGEPSQ